MAPAKKISKKQMAPAKKISKKQMAPAKKSSKKVGRLVKISKTITIRSLDVSNTVNTVDKKKYSEMEDVATNLQKVFFTGKKYVNGQVLDYETKDGSNVHMNLHVGAIHRVHVKVSWSEDKLIPFDVCDWDTINDLKTKLQDKEGTPASQVTLIYNGNQLEDFETLAPYDVPQEAIFYAVLLGEEKIKIFIRMKGKESIKLEVKQCSSVENIKTMFRCMVGFPIDQQKLTFDGVLLENDRKLSDYKVEMESVLDMAYLAPGLMKIFVNLLNGTKCAIFVNSSDTIYGVKKKIQYRTGVKEVQTILLFGWRRLNENLTVGDYNIQKEDTIDMLIHQCGC